MIIMFLKRLKCKHKNIKYRWDYPQQWVYNDFFDKAQTTRYKEVYCENCGKILDTVFAQPVFTDFIYEEVKEEYLKNNSQFLKSQKKGDVEK